MELFYEVSTRTSSACNKSLLKQRKCILVIKVKPISIYNQNYTNNYLKQRNVISLNTSHVHLPNINFLHLNCSTNTVKQIFQCFPSYNLGPILPKVISTVFKVNFIITLRHSSFIAIMQKLSK